MLERILKNIRKVRKTQSITQKEIAKGLQISTSTYNKIESGEIILTVDKLIGIASFFGLEIEELLSNTQNAKFTDNAKLIPTTVQAGFLGGQLTDFDEQNLTAFQLPMFDDKELFVIKVIGDSMYPTFQNGNFLVIKKAEIEHLKWGEPYVLITEDGELLKRIYAHPQNEKIILKSDNPQYSEQTISVSQVNSFWIIKGLITKI